MVGLRKGQAFILILAFTKGRCSNMKKTKIALLVSVFGLTKRVLVQLGMEEDMCSTRAFEKMKTASHLVFAQKIKL